MRWVHACEGAGLVRLKHQGERFEAGLDFGAASAYFNTAAETQTVGFADPRGELLQSGIRFDPDGFYTLVLWGRREDPHLLMVEDRLPQAAGSASIRWIHAAIESPALELRSELGIRLLAQLESGGIADYRAVPVGGYGLKLTEAGAVEALADLVPQPFAAGGALTLIVARDRGRYRLIQLRDR